MSHHHKDHHHKDHHKDHKKDEPKDEPQNEANENKQAEPSAPKEEKREPVTVSITDIELEQLRKEAAEFKDKYLRTLAEGENARKRLQKEKLESNSYATQNVILDFLHPIDHMDNALKFTQDASEEVKHWGLGFQMILTQFKDVLSNNNVMPIEAKGKPFDHNFHEAVETVETNDYAPGTVVEEFIKGYKMGDKVIRAARVKVAKAPSAAAPEQENKNS